MRNVSKAFSLYDFNLLVSCSWGAHHGARAEIIRLLKRLGDEHPLVKHTPAKGLIGVRTVLPAREVTKGLRAMVAEDPSLLYHTRKWVPVDLWTRSDIDSMKEAVMEIRDRIKDGETWRMTVEKRRYTACHRIEIIKVLAELIGAKVDLDHPDKILRIDLIGRYAAISVLTPEEIFSLAFP